jgi:hypothetical protein
VNAYAPSGTFNNDGKILAEASDVLPRPTSSWSRHGPDRPSCWWEVPPQASWKGALIQGVMLHYTSL